MSRSVVYNSSNDTVSERDKKITVTLLSLVFAKGPDLSHSLGQGLKNTSDHKLLQVSLAQ